MFDPRKLLSSPKAYSIFANLVSGNAQGRFVNEYLRPAEYDRVLDIGCGPGNLLGYLPATVDYLGFDGSPTYIAAAKRKFGTRGQFFCQLVKDDALEKIGEFDIVTATGVLHHLDNAESEHLFDIAKRALKPNGRLVTVDNVYTSTQSAVARFLISRDRGEFVRDEAGYVALAKSRFERVDVSILDDLLRIPYTHLIMTCHAMHL
jgi:SAM-dependent methyltransferase